MIVDAGEGNDMGKERPAATRIVLVRHALPVIDPGRPAREWVLDGGAAASVTRLADALRDMEVDGILTSPEPKASGTARLIASELGLAVTEDSGLREQGGDRLPWFSDPEDFFAAVAEHFARPHNAVLGAESSTGAVNRFAAAIDRACADCRFPVVVTHGRVMCGYIGRVLGTDPMVTWRELRLPDAFMLDVESGTCSRVE